MKKYYLFIINNNYFKIYKNKSYVLYIVLEKLYNMNSYDFSYGINIYNQICEKINVKLLKKYFNNRIKHLSINNKMKLVNENTWISLKYPCIIIYSDNEESKIYRIFNIYNHDIFMCDFKNKKYFWLNKYIKNR